MGVSDDDRPLKILVVGTGSIGQRHIKNFQQLGCHVVGVDTREDRRQQCKVELNIGCLDDLSQALEAAVNFDGIIIATPPAFHVEQLNLCLAKSPDAKILMEKNLCLEAKEIADITDFGLAQEKVLMGYTWRWWPTLQIAKQRLNEIGPIRRVVMTMAAHLADWHPWEPVEEFYAASRGGVTNEAHWHDILLDWFGWPDWCVARASHISDLNTPTADVLDFYAEYDGPDKGFRVNLHYDLFQRPHDRSMQIVGEKGTMFWTPNLLKIGHFKDPEFRTWDSKIDRNAMFLDMAMEFCGFIHDIVETPTCTLVDGARVMHLMQESLARGVLSPDQEVRQC
jgi:predicted dehydrogenase